MECLEAHTRLEQKKKAVLRRQQRELQKQKREAEAREKELQKLAARCREMEEEERLSVAMEASFRHEEEQQRMEIQRLEELKLYKLISKTRKKTMDLGISVSTPGVSGLQRLRLLETRIVEKELVVKKSNEAKLRLDVLSAKGNKFKQLMHSFSSSSLRQKVENAVYHQYWDRLVPLFDPPTSSSGNRSSDLLNHESENGLTPYEELNPDLYVGHEPKEVAQTNQENSLQYSAVKSANCVTEMRALVLGDNFVSLANVSPRSVDPEVENYQRKKRIAKEKAISQMQINVPVVAAKHAAQAGEETIFTQPAELELAALYTTQKKYDKARELLLQVEKLIVDSLGILHPTMLKVAIEKARVSQETGHFEQCSGMMEDALSLFESVLPLDHKDVLTATSMLLQSLDALEHYHKAVLTCQHVYSIRVRALLPSHKLLKEICEQLDEFISKRETVEMSKEDLITLEKIEQERKRMEQLASESEKHLASFRRLMMEDPEGLATFLAFAKQEFAEDLVTLWISIEECKEDGIDSKTLRSRAVDIYLTYIKSRRIKVITTAQRKKIKKAITTPGKKLSDSIYDDLQAQVFEVVYKGVYVRYLAQAAK
ncbi:hypothetical protein JG688_00007515 [Phytophthora aleatoria]|uniref:RGS domain-containing protein n=1 Tax=Phytophthora aleatoria TaxID=2496075 RepID=A0A8J5IVE0_9STRA|nr:hypothetical protein JG688_00007515 [Phytophthora aleatoria]